jgi:hypothetical protein
MVTGIHHHRILRDLMDTIIRNDLNEGFLREAEERGYRAYVDQTNLDLIRSHPGFYMGSVQKRVRDDQGTRYFIGIEMFNLGVVTSKALVRFSARASVQFHVDDARKKVANVNVEFTSFEEIEDFFDTMWRKMGFGYYERS